MTSESWNNLKPLKNEYENIEFFEDYYERIKSKIEYSHIPSKVFEQWLWAHHDKAESIINYGWLDYENIEFELCNWSNEQLENIYIIDYARDYFELRASYSDFDNFRCTQEDLKFWQEKGTWKTPPIILDIQSLGKVPIHCELKPPYQLVEGHSRLGYLHSMFTIEKLRKGNVATTHEIYLMKKTSLIDVDNFKV